MKLYLVRHGESEWSALKKHQDAKAGLSAEGIKQAEFVAKRFMSIPVDVILSSPFERAKQTAEIIGNKLNKPVKTSDLLREMKRPTVIEGRATDEPEVVEIKKAILDNYHNPDYRHSDEETFFELKQRAIEALNEITKLTEENVLVVTHGIFIQMLFGVMCLSETLQPDNFKSLRKTMMLKNTGLTLCEYKNKAWRLVTWNDHAHF